VSEAVDQAVRAVRAGEPVVLPFDTVYGLASDPYRWEPARRLYQLKQRSETQPSAFVATDLEYLLECVPELRGRAARVARVLLPGPYTLIFPNPARRFRWITGSEQDAIGIRVPDFAGPGAEVLERVGALVATSANNPGDPDPGRLDEVPQHIRDGAAAVVDGGPLPGTPSTVLDFTGDEPRVVRQGAASADEALGLLSSLRA
jgi:L-threonylcarbamoyladenylate synthase